MELNESLEQDKEILSHDLLKLVGRFLSEHPSDAVGVDVHISTERPTMAMTEDGKFHTGRTVLCTIGTWADPAEFGDDLI